MMMSRVGVGKRELDTCVYKQCIPCKSARPLAYRLLENESAPDGEQRNLLFLLKRMRVFRASYYAHRCPRKPVARF